MLNCNSQRAEGLQEAFFSPADRIQGSFISQLLVPSVVDTLESSNSSQEIQSQDHQKLGSIHLQGFEDHSLFGPNTHGMGSLDLLTGSSGMSMAMDQGDMKFADMDTWNSLGPGPSIPSTTYRSLLASSGLMDHSSMDYGHHSGSLEQVTCTAMQSPMYHERSTRMDSCRESDSSLSSQSQSFHSSLLPPVGISSTISRNTALQGGGPCPGSGGLALPIRKGISFDAGLGLNIHHPRFDYNLGQQFMNMETPTFMNHSMESQIHLGTPISLDQAVLCGLPINAYNVGGGGMRLPTEHQGLTHFAQILPSKALKSSPVQFTAPQNFLFGSNLTAAPTGLKLPALNFKCNPPKLEQLSPKLFDGYTASQQSSVCDGRPPKKERHSETYISFRGTKTVVDDHAESTGPIDLFTKNINVMAGSPGIGSLSSEQSTHTSTSPDSVSKRPRLHDQAPAAANLPFKVRKEKLGEKITALQQLVSPFGKTDTASVLLEAIGYIKFLQDQVQLLSTPYMKNVCLPTSTHDIKQQWATDNVKTGGEADLSDLRSKGLCLIPISTIRVANDNGADYWTPTIGGSSR